MGKVMREKAEQGWNSRRQGATEMTSRVDVLSVTMMRNSSGAEPQTQWQGKEGAHDGDCALLVSIIQEA